MLTTISLEEMTTADKLRTMELLWSDLLSKTASIPTPAWHEKVLAERAEQVQQGLDGFSDWTEAKRRIRESLA